MLGRVKSVSGWRWNPLTLVHREEGVWTGWKHKARDSKPSPECVRSPEEPAYNLLAAARWSRESRIELLRERHWGVGGGKSGAGIPRL